MRVLDSAGHQIATTLTTATCGTGCRGNYAATLAFSVPKTEPGTIEVYMNSPKTGLPVDVQTIPVILAL